MEQRELRQKLASFQIVLRRLEEGVRREDKDTLVIDGVIQRFEFTFELAWKLMKLFIEEEGTSGVCLSPKTTVKQAFKREIIVDGEAWIKMIQDRNLTSHMYDVSMARRIYLSIENEYIVLLRELNKFMEQNI